MDISRVISSLKSKNYSVHFFEKAEEAVQYLCDVHQNQTIGLGDSMTLTSLGLYERLSRNNQVYAPQKSETNVEFLTLAGQTLKTDSFITSVNALSEDGYMVNIDGTGNRIAASIFGHQKVYFVLGTNKIVPTQAEALWRAQNIAAPKNAQRLKRKTPCALKADRCYNCSSPERICNGTILYQQKMNDIAMEVLLINQNLGF